jgi:hypothetical protein
MLVSKGLFMFVDACRITPENYNGINFVPIVLKRTKLEGFSFLCS